MANHGDDRLETERPVRILHVEDNVQDQELVAAALRSEELKCEILCVTTEQEFREALCWSGINLILSDSALPSFDGFQALAVAKMLQPEVPFVFVSGTIGEERAVESLKGGATDYVLKDRLHRLGSVVRRALREARERAEHRRAEAHIRQLNRIYAVLSAINQLILRGDEPQAALDSSCRIAVEKGGFRLAWIGMLDATGHLVKPVAAAGVSEGYLDAIHLDLRVAAHSAAPIGRALRSGEHQVSNDIENDPLMEPWRAAALARGYRSAAAFPLTVADKSAGILVLYAAETDFFDADELGLLDELARDIAFALENCKRAQERQHALEELRASEERFREFAQTVEEVFWITDTAKSRMLYISPAYERIWGCSCQSLYEKPGSWLEAIHPDDRERVRLAAATQPAGGAYDEEYRIVRPDQQVRWIRDTAFPVRNAAGQVERLVGVASDVTDRRQMAEQLRQSQKMEAIGLLAGGVAHDFNNLLAVIQLQTDLLKTDDSFSPAQSEYVKEINDATRRAAALTSQLLLFSRKQTMQMRDLDLNQSIHDLTKMLWRTLGEDIELQFKFAMQSLFLHADASMVDQVLMNLAVNARDAMPQGGRLVIETSAVDFDDSVRGKSAQARPGAFVCLSVSDTGCGIPPENLPRIFEPFYTTKDVGRGTGLGLATVFGIVQQHKGWINVYSEVGRGTTFRIYFPRLAGISGQKPDPPALTTLPGGDETILLVEDDAFLRAAMRMALSQLGYRVIEAINGKEALKIWKQHEDAIQLLLTDLVMPGGLNGMHLAKRLLQENPKLKVIYASGYSAEVAGSHSTLEAGVNFLTKPFEALKLAQTVRNRLDQP